MWIPPENADPVLYHAPTRKSVAIFGAVCPADGRLVTLSVSPFNTATFQVFLGLLLRHARPNRKIFLVVDNARFVRQIAMEHEITIISGKVSCDHIHVLIAYRPHTDISTIVQWLKGISSRVLLQEYPHLRKRLWGRHFWARGYLAVSTGTLTDEMVKKYIADQEGEPVQDDSRFVIDNPLNPPPSRRSVV